MRLPRFIERLPFSPSDWLILVVIGAIGVFALGWLLQAASYRFTTEVPARGGTYQEGIVGVPRFINPILAISDADRDMTELVFSGLLKADNDGTLSPDVASGYTVSDDKKTYTFTIRDGATFQDGTPITAEDVAFTVGLAQDPSIKSPKRANWDGVEVHVIDAKTISFTLKSPYAPFLENTTLGILPKHVWASVSAEEFPFSNLNLQAIGSGPYKIDSINNSAAGVPSQVNLVAFSKARQVPYITHMAFSFYTDSESLYTAVQRNPNLAAHSLVPTDLQSHSVQEAILDRVFGVFFNQNQNDLFADKAVRAALDAAVDKPGLVSTLVSGYGSPLVGPLPPDSVVAATTTATSSDDRVVSAKGLLTAAGWAPGADGVMAKKVGKATKRLSFTLVTGNAPELKHAAELVADDWRAIGANVTTQFFEQSDLQQSIIRPRKYEALLFGEVIGRDLDLFPFWDSSQRNDPGLNIALYVNNSVDKKLEEARTIEDVSLRRAAEEDAAAIIASEHAAVFLYSPHFVYLVPKNVQGMSLGTVSTPSDRFLSVTSWYLDTERVWPFFAQ